ncbi:unnamed protein product [Coffea canephora]|uniref:Uncharacterized protein n=1 Tax=Coffea canephora TaxID=49390 RepID=A0A068U712_COFCA|nr:unnamed protein product [Coffea canephora]
MQVEDMSGQATEQHCPKKGEREGSGKKANAADVQKQRNTGTWETRSETEALCANNITLSITCAARERTTKTIQVIRALRSLSTYVEKFSHKTSTNFRQQPMGKENKSKVGKGRGKF